MITDEMVQKVYSKINFWDHGSDGIADGIEEVFRDHLAELMESAPDLHAVKMALVREQVIRDAMEKTGESRPIVAKMLGAVESMDQETVLSLTDGGPTTLADALGRYIKVLEQVGDLEPEISDIALALNAILTFPYPAELPVHRCSYCTEEYTNAEDARAHVRRTHSASRPDSPVWGPAVY